MSKEKNEELPSKDKLPENLEKDELIFYVATSIGDRLTAAMMTLMEEAMNKYKEFDELTELQYIALLSTMIMPLVVNNLMMQHKVASLYRDKDDLLQILTEEFFQYIKDSLDRRDIKEHIEKMKKKNSTSH